MPPSYNSIAVSDDDDDDNNNNNNNKFGTYSDFHLKCRISLSDCTRIGIFLYRFSRKSPVSHFTKIRLEGAALITCGQTDMTKLMGAFREYANAPEGSRYIQGVPGGMDKTSGECSLG